MKSFKSFLIILIIVLYFFLFVVDCRRSSSRSASARGRSAYRRGKKAEDNAARDIRRNWLRRNEGYRRQVPFSTPYGKRTLDGAIYNKRSGQIIEGVEVKSGNSRYGGLQKKKDAWIQKELGIPVSLYHRP